METTYTDSWSDMAKPSDMDLWVMKWRSAWPIFHGPVILPYILKTIWCMNIIHWFYESVWPDIWPQNKIGHCDPYFMVQWFCLISWGLFDVWTSLFGIMSQYDQTFDLKINVGHCDLYFMVQLFCVISWKLFDVWTLYFGIVGQYDPTFDLKINVGHCDLYFMVQWFWLVPKTIWWMNIILWDCGSVWPHIWPQNKCRSLWPIFHGPVILPYISKTIWWMSVIFSDNETVWPKLWPQNKCRSTWSIFHCLVTLLNIFKIIWCMNIIVVIMDQCDTKIDRIKYM